MILLAVDLDGTFVGDSPAAKHLLAFIQPLRDKGELKFVYASGRSLERIKLLSLDDYPGKPDAVIAATGTEIYVNDVALDDWQDTFNKGWNRKEIADICTEVTGLIPQPASEQRPYKISFETNVPTPDSLAGLQKALSKEAPGAVILSSHGGQFVDIVPAGSDKGSAVHFLAHKWSISEDNIYAAGDSANDITMLEKAKAIVVGNVYAELKSWYEARPELPVYFAKNKFAAGITEGLEHYLGSS